MGPDLSGPLGILEKKVKKLEERIEFIESLILKNITKIKKPKKK